MLGILDNLSAGEMATLSVALGEYIRNHPDDAVTQDIAVPLYDRVEADWFGGRDTVDNDDNENYRPSGMG
jgi:hypothetical protein